jgi:hypothetical protein
MTVTPGGAASDHPPRVKPPKVAGPARVNARAVAGIARRSALRPAPSCSWSWRRGPGSPSRAFSFRTGDVSSGPMSRFLNAGRSTRGSFRVFGGGSVLAAVAPTLAIIGLAWTLPACCCGGGVAYPLTPGPPGTITGRLIPPFPGAAKAGVVYAVSYEPGSDALDAPRYAMTRVDTASPTYSLTVPTGYYNVIARFDSEPLQFGGYTDHIHNGVNGEYSLASVGVSAQQRVDGIDIGDWGTTRSADLGWSIDVHGLPLFDPLLPSASPTYGTIRDSPSQPDPILSSNYVDTAFGVHLLLPTGWIEVKAPGSYASYGAFFANENVVSPLNLDDKGVWLSILYGGIVCPTPDWRFVVETVGVRMIDGVESFSWEDPPAIVGPQPFTGSGLFAGSMHGVGKQCVQFIFKGTTKPALESNLATFISLLHVARFYT